MPVPLTHSHESANVEIKVVRLGPWLGPSSHPIWTESSVLSKLDTPFSLDGKTMCYFWVGNLFILRSIAFKTKAHKSV